MPEKIVMFDSPEAATYRTDIKGWVSRTGLFYGDNLSSEHGARWSGCTHMKCGCGAVIDKGRLRCRSCQGTMDSTEYYALPMVEWDGKTPVCDFNTDKFFFDGESLLDWMADLEEGTEVQLVICKERYLHPLDGDEWSDDLPDEGELSDEVGAAIDALNVVLKAEGPVSWWPGRERIDVDKIWAELKAEKEQEIR
jgi:hypothetical protein